MFDFVPVRVSIDRDLRTRIDLTGNPAPMRIFHLTDIPNYERAMFTAMLHLLSGMAARKPER